MLFVPALFFPASAAIPHPNQVLLIHGDDADGTLTFVDETGNHTVSANTGVGLTFVPEIDTAQSKFGGSSILFPKTGGYPDFSQIHTNNGAGDIDFAFGTGDYSVDCWIRFASIAN